MRESQRDRRLILSCEHGGNRVPDDLKHIFAHRSRLLESHRGYDPGALELAESIRSATRAPLISATTSRLVIELNRSINHHDLFSEYMVAATPHQRHRLKSSLYYPYRKRVRNRIDHAIADTGLAIHLSIHSFTPVLRGQVRLVDIGVLFDPARPKEARFCAQLVRELIHYHPRLRVRRNSPYKGTSDGLTTLLRDELPESMYIGVELEVKQRFPRSGGTRWQKLQASITESILRTLRAFPG